MIRYYILQAHIPLQVDMMTWAQWFENPAHRIVKQETVGGAKISTVFLGIDHGLSRGPPLVFETMIFGGRHHNWMARCSTWHDAEEQHERARALVQETPVRQPTT